MPVPTMPPTTSATVANRPSRSSGAPRRSSAGGTRAASEIRQGTRFSRSIRTPLMPGGARGREPSNSSGGCSCLRCGADGLGEQRENRSFSTTVVTFTDVRVANLAAAIDEIHGRPVLVSVRIPSDEVVVQPDRILEPVLLDGTLDVLNGPLKCELGTVDADDPEVGLVLVVQSTQEWEGALAVHAREGPELEQDDAVAKGRESQRLAVRGVEPRIDADQFRSAAEDRQRMRSILLDRCPRGVSAREGHSLVDGGGRGKSLRSRWGVR